MPWCVSSLYNRTNRIRNWSSNLNVVSGGYPAWGEELSTIPINNKFNIEILLSYLVSIFIQLVAFCVLNVEKIFFPSQDKRWPTIWMEVKNYFSETLGKLPRKCEKKTSFELFGRIGFRTDLYNLWTSTLQIAQNCF